MIHIKKIPRAIKKSKMTIVQKIIPSLRNFGGEVSKDDAQDNERGKMIPKMSSTYPGVFCGLAERL